VQPFKLVKLKRENRYARVLAIDTSSPAGTLVRYQIIRPRLVSTAGWEAPTRGRTGGPEAVSPSVVNAEWEEYVDDPRNFYLGPTPSRNSAIGKQVEARMRDEKKIVGNDVLYARDAAGNPLPPGQTVRYPLSSCAMGHIIDAVTWWNSNGRFTGPQSPEAQKFMEDPDNYELEPSGPNSLRGALLGGSGVRYLPSTK
jgi:hypothetical protein